MIEIIQQNEKTEDGLENKLPKNIRQIGNPEKDFRIYMEDYVYTYLHPAQIHGAGVGLLPRLLILLGEINHFSNRSCAFISGAIQVENSDCPEELPEFNDKAWRLIHKEMQRYFDKCEVVGWVLDIPGNTLEVSLEMEEVHRRNFVSQYQFFFLMDSREREEAFYTWKDGHLTRKEGYFIYYEKNPQMQEYMVSQREAIFGETLQVEEVKDQAAKNYRAMMMEKKKYADKRRSGLFSYLTSILTVIVLCSVSVLLLRNIHRMDHMEQAISVMSVAMESTEQENVKNQVAVEAVSGNVLPVEPAAEETQQPETETAASEAKIGQAGQEAPADIAPPQESAAEESMLQDVAPVTTEATPPEDIPVAEEAAPQEAVPAQPSEEPAEPVETAPPEEAATSEPPVMTEAEVCLAQGYYIVQPGDSLHKICYKIYQDYSMLNALCEKNAIIDKDTIFIGQKIILP